MNDIERLKWEKKNIPKIDKYCPIFFVVGLIIHFLTKTSAMSMPFIALFFLTKVGVIFYTSNFSVTKKLNDKKMENAQKEVEAKEMIAAKEVLGSDELSDEDVKDAEELLGTKEE